MWEGCWRVKKKRLKSDVGGMSAGGVMEKERKFNVDGDIMRKKKKDLDMMIGR